MSKNTVLKVSDKTLARSAKRDADVLTPRQWNALSQRLIGFSTQLSKNKREPTKDYAAKSAKP